MSVQQNNFLIRSLHSKDLSSLFSVSEFLRLLKICSLLSRKTKKNSWAKDFSVQPNEVTRFLHSAWSPWCHNRVTIICEFYYSLLLARYFHFLVSSFRQWHLKKFDTFEKPRHSSLAPFYMRVWDSGTKHIKKPYRVPRAKFFDKNCSQKCAMPPVKFTQTSILLTGFLILLSYHKKSETLQTVW